LKRQQIPPPRALGATATSPRFRCPAANHLILKSPQWHYVAIVPSDTFTHTAEAAASVGEVWATLDQPSTWESIGGVDRVFDPTIDAEGRLRGFSFDTIAAGRRYVGVATPDQRVEKRVMSWRIRNSEVHGVTKVELAPSNPGTSITVTLEVESAGLLSAMFFPIIAGAIGNGLPRAVDGFAAGFSQD
jgi:carbon monoxide dehydrogenase subunit G